MLHIYVDADACPVKDEVYRVAKRCGLEVTLVANAWMRVPERAWLRFQLVPESADAADDWIAEHVEAGDIVVTADIPLASRCLEKGAAVIGPDGRSFDEGSIGEALATRELMERLRGAGEIGGGPAPRSNRDRSRFLQELDRVIQSIHRESGSG
jgi:hypothetical protein